MCVVVQALTFSLLLSGMMVEVLGTVLGTAIQGQIVGGASNCPDPDELDSSNSTIPTGYSLEETVSFSRVLHCVTS